MQKTYTFSEAKKIAKCILMGGRTPFIWGQPGIGKSTIGREIAQEFGLDLFVLDAPLVQPIDYMCPVPNYAEKKIELYPGGFIPKKGVLLIEDLPHAKTYQTVPIMQMVLDKRIGNVDLSEVKFIITGNREEDYAGVNPTISTINNRVAHIDMTVNVQEWVNWAKNNNLHPYIIDFIRGNEQFFIEMPKTGVKAFPTPRSWHAASDTLIANPDMSTNDMADVVGTWVGNHIASVFYSFVVYYRNINPMNIIQTGKLPEHNNRAHLFAIISSVCYKIDMKIIEKYGENLISIYRALEGDFKIYYLKEIAMKNTQYIIKLMDFDNKKEISDFVTNLI